MGILTEGFTNGKRIVEIYKGSTLIWKYISPGFQFPFSNESLNSPTIEFIQK